MAKTKQRKRPEFIRLLNEAMGGMSFQDAQDLTDVSRHSIYNWNRNEIAPSESEPVRELADGFKQPRQIWLKAAGYASAPEDRVWDREKYNYVDPDDSEISLNDNEQSTDLKVLSVLAMEGILQAYGIVNNGVPSSFLKGSVNNLGGGLLFSSFRSTTPGLLDPTIDYAVTTLEVLESLPPKPGWRYLVMEDGTLKSETEPGEREVIGVVIGDLNLY